MRSSIMPSMLYVKVSGFPTDDGGGATIAVSGASRLREVFLRRDADNRAAATTCIPPPPPPPRRAMIVAQRTDGQTDGRTTGGQRTSCGARRALVMRRQPKLNRTEPNRTQQRHHTSGQTHYNVLPVIC